MRKQQKFKNGTEWDMPMLNVFHRRGKVIRHFWGSELLYVPPEPGQEYRHNDALSSLWNILDLTPEGRGDFHPKLNYPPTNPKGKMTLRADPNPSNRNRWKPTNALRPS